MDATIVVKLAHCLTIFMFTLAISGMKKRTGMTPLGDIRFTTILKYLYLAPVAIYTYLIIKINHFKYLDFIYFIITVIATLIVIRARFDLNKYHTWAGYHLKDTKLIKNGIYSYIRHPLYLGVIIFYIGGFLTIAPHYSLFIFILGLIFFIYLLSFLLIIAQKESRKMEQIFGEEYIAYKNKVHAFLPLRKFD